MTAADNGWLGSISQQRLDQLDDLFMTLTEYDGWVRPPWLQWLRIQVLRSQVDLA